MTGKIVWVVRQNVANAQCAFVWTMHVGILGQFSPKMQVRNLHEKIQAAIRGGFLDTRDARMEVL